MKPYNYDNSNAETVTVTNYDNINFAKMSREKLFSIIVELIKENKMLTSEIGKLRNEIQVGEVKVKNVSLIEKKYNDKIDLIIEKLCPDLANQNDMDKKMPIDAKLYSLIAEVQKDKKRYLDKIDNQKEKIKSQKILLEGLKDRLLKFVEMQNRESSSSTEETEEIKPVQVNTPTTPDVPHDVTTTRENVSLVAISIDTMTQELDNVSKSIIMAIGAKGLSQFPEISKYVVTDVPTTNDSRFEICFNKLMGNGVLDVDQVPSFNHPRGVRVASLSKKLGVPIYQKLTKKNPVVCEKEVMIKENDNLQHGYSIKDVCEYLETLRYENVTMDRANNTIKFEGQRSWIPDIIAKNPITKRMEYFEVEYGNHTEENFNDKLTKANLKTSSLKIIVPNKAVKLDMIEKVNNWKKSFKTSPKATPSIDIIVLTFGEFKLKDNIDPAKPQTKIVTTSDSDEV